MNIRTARAWGAALCVAAIGASVWVPAALAEGTGDDSRPTEDVLTAREAALKARLERETENAGTTRPRGEQTDIAPLIVDAPYRYLYTPSHEQERTYWCGPATCQVIDDYLGAYVSQSTYAASVGTTTKGTDFSLVDDCLRRYTSKPFYYYGGLQQSGFYARVSDSLMNHGLPLAVDVNIIASIWPYYEHDHAGHIVPIEAFDWRYGTIRLNDVYDEAGVGGGPTYGHTTYDRAVIWNGVYNHFRRAVVSAP